MARNTAKVCSYTSPMVSVPILFVTSIYRNTTNCSNCTLHLLLNILSPIPSKGKSGKKPPLRLPPARRIITLLWRFGPTTVRRRRGRLVRLFLAICHIDKMLYIAIGAMAVASAAVFIWAVRRTTPESELELTEWQAMPTRHLSTTLGQAFTRF